MGAIAGWNADRERQRKLHRRATLWLLFARHAGGGDLTRPRGSACGYQPFAAGGVEKMDFLAPYRQR
ncbi:hypothetical protein RORB6_03385 [Raoultella ornithinolytica B6]|nr:hypothetical protein RORB6_03385 [Raoultella ornithinolytica B6]